MDKLLKVIVIDDEPIVLEQFTTMDIWDENHFTLAASFSSAEEAEEYMSKNSVDAVLCDINLPGKSGLEFAKIVKTDHPQTMVVLISAYSEFEYARQAINLGIKEYLIKPLTKNALRQCLENLYNSYCSEIATKSAESFSLQHILTSLAMGDIDSPDILSKEISSLSISESVLEYPVIFFNVHIHATEEYLSDTWRYGRTRLYNAVSFILVQPTQHFNVYLIRYVNNDFECAAVSKHKALNHIEELFDSICSMFTSTLKIDVEITLQSKFENILCVNNTNSILDAKNSTAIDDAIRYIEENFNNPLLDLNLVTKNVFLSKAYFSHMFRKKTGVTFISYLNEVRIEKSKTYVADKNVKISSIYEFVGYKNPRYFYKIFKKLTGLTPLQYREKYSNTLNTGEEL